jgi:hypothetical protein
MAKRILLCTLAALLACQGAATARSHHRVTAVQSVWAEWGHDAPGRDYEYVGAQMSLPSHGLLGRVRYRDVGPNGDERYIEAVARDAAVHLTFGRRFRWAQLTMRARITGCTDEHGRSCHARGLVSARARFTADGKLVRERKGGTELVGRLAKVTATVGPRAFGWATYAEFGRNRF